MILIVKEYKDKKKTEGATSFEIYLENGRNIGKIDTLSIYI